MAKPRKSLVPGDDPSDPTRELHIFEDGPAVARGFADRIVQKQREKGKDAPLFWALSGGSTPKLLFKLMAEEYKDKLDWSRVHFFWGDDRLVPYDDPESNYGEVKRLLFDHVPVVQEQIHAVPVDGSPEECARKYGETLAKVLPMNSDGLPMLDINMLGMGGDGHTASIFPNQMNLLKSDELCAVATHPESGQKRVTMTGKVLNASDEVVFLITGEGKAQRVGQIILRQKGYEKLPVSHIQPTSGALHWYLDEAAAGELTDG